MVTLRFQTLPVVMMAVKCTGWSGSVNIQVPLTVKLPAGSLLVVPAMLEDPNFCSFFFHADTRRLPLDAHYIFPERSMLTC
jgi:hypothetical protein